MRIVFVQHFELPSPMAHAVQIVSTAAALARRGNEVEVHVRAGSPTAAREAASAILGAEPPPSLAIMTLASRHKTLAGVEVRARLLRHLVRGGAVLYARHRRLASWALRARRRLHRSATIAYEFHNLEHVLAREGGAAPQDVERIRVEEQRLARDCDGLVAVSQPLADDVRGAFAPRAPLEVIPDGVDPGAFDGEHPQALSREIVRAVYAGSLYPHKGVEVLLDALALLPPSVRLVVAGGNPPEELERLRARAGSEPNLRGRVEFTGQLDHRAVPRELTASDLVLLPASDASRSQRYTSPLKVFEAMASGVPIVAAPSPALMSVLRDGETALVAASAAPADLAAAVRRALEDRTRARAIGAAAREAAGEFGWDRRAERIERFLARIA